MADEYRNNALSFHLKTSETYSNMAEKCVEFRKYIANSVVNLGTQLKTKKIISDKEKPVNATSNQVFASLQRVENILLELGRYFKEAKEFSNSDPKIQDLIKKQQDVKIKGKLLQNIENLKKLLFRNVQKSYQTY